MRLPGRPSSPAALMLPALLLGLALVGCQPRSEQGPGLQRCVAWWNSPDNRSYREALGDPPFPLVTVQSIGPSKAGQPGCVGLLRDARMGRGF
jgi:hypothetical protein